jgi:lipopolysaccharide transport system ATP-binding protein
LPTSFEFRRTNRSIIIQGILSMSKPVISVENLSKRYIIGHQRAETEGIRHVIESAVQAPFKWARSRQEEKKRQREEFWALKGISFEVKQGEVVGFIGSNGAGKSTMFKLLSRITEPTTGRICMEGRAASLLEVGTGFHPELTGRENIFLNGAILGMPKSEIERKFDEIVAFSEVEKFLDTPVKRYSSGMYVRLAFSVAAHLDPDILIVDEVLAVGDAAFQSKCLEKMQEDRVSARTVLFVSHNLKAVENFCTRGVVLSGGLVTFDGPVKDAIQHYLESVQGNRLPCYGDVIDLATIKRRSSRHHPQIKQLSLFNVRGEPLGGSVPAGGGIRAMIEIQLEQPRQKVDVELSFFNIDGERVCTAHSAYEPDRNGGEMSGRLVFVCDIPRLPLVPGEYKLHVGLDVEMNEADCVDDAARLIVTACDYYGTGVAPTLGVFMLENRWKVISDGAMLKNI